MYFSISSILGAATTFLVVVSAAPLTERGTTKAYFLLAGDSTTAPVQSGAGGWGDGFGGYAINRDTASVWNAGVPGASSSSYISSGKWSDLMTTCKNYKKSNFKVFVTIQFGHNDENQNLGTSGFSTNIKKMISDVNDCGAIPIVVSPLSRRFFRSDGTISDSLKPYRDAALSVAKSAGSKSIDLWQNSVTYLQKIGPTSAHKLDLTSGDSTHINSKGSVVFGRMVADLMYNGFTSDVGAYISSDKALSKQIADGTPTY